MSVEKQIHNYLISKKLTLALAESCTGGQLSALFTAMPDASKYFLGSLVIYSTELKHHILKVSRDTIVRNGAESRETTDEMLIGLLKITDADFGIAVTGLAGPSGGSKEKPVGTVYIAVGSKGRKPHVVECHFKGSRSEVIQAACQRALEELAALVSPSL